MRLILLAAIFAATSGCSQGRDTLTSESSKNGAQHDTAVNEMEPVDFAAGQIQDSKSRDFGYDLVADYIEFLKLLGIEANPWELDSNKIVIDIDAWEKGAPAEYTSNGIPDIAEIYLLQYVLQNPQIENTTEVFEYEPVRDAWLKNRKAAMGEMSSVPNSVQRVAAAFMTICDLQDTAYISEILYKKYKIKQNAHYYENLDELFAHDGNVDGDAKSNLEEWESQPLMPPEERVKDYAVAATNMDK